MKTKHRIKGYIIFAMIAVIVPLVAFYFPALKQYFSPAFLREYFLSWGFWGYFMLFFMIIISIPLPTPSAPFILAGGYVYGTIVGASLALIAGALGGTILFFLARTYGRSLVEQIVDKHHIVHFNHVFKKRGEAAALLSFAIPVFPNDAVIFLLGLTKMKYRTFILLVLIGHIPRYLLITFFGNDLFAGFTLQTGLILVIGVAFILIALFREKIKRFLFKELKTLEKDVGMQDLNH